MGQTERCRVFTVPPWRRFDWCGGSAHFGCWWPILIKIDLWNVSELCQLISYITRSFDIDGGLSTRVGRPRSSTPRDGSSVGVWRTRVVRTGGEVALPGVSFDTITPSLLFREIIWTGLVAPLIQVQQMPLITQKHASNIRTDRLLLSSVP